jgi:serine/threonine protein kinase
LKPANILLKKTEPEGICVKIADFGLSAIYKLSRHLTGGTGTPGYMAPEVINNEKYDTKADVYSLGIIFRNLFFLNMNL